MAPPALPLTPPGHPAATHFLLPLPWKTPADSAALRHLLAKSLFGGEFCPVAKSQRGEERESSRITMHSLRQHLLLIPHRNGVLHYLGFCPSAGFIFRLNYLRFRGAASCFFCAMLGWASRYVACAAAGCLQWDRRGVIGKKINSAQLTLEQRNHFLLCGIISNEDQTGKERVSF